MQAAEVGNSDDSLLERRQMSTLRKRWGRCFLCAILVAGLLTIAVMTLQDWKSNGLVVSTTTAPRADWTIDEKLEVFLKQYQGKNGIYGLTGGAATISDGERGREAAVGCSVCRNDGAYSTDHISAHSQTSGFDEEPMLASTPMQFASNTKVFTAAMVLKLVDDGLLNLDDSADKYLPVDVAESLTCRNAPAFPTVRNLLRMQSGWTDTGDDDRIGQDEPRCRNRSHWTQTEVLQKYAGFPRGCTASGGPAQYANINYIVLGWILTSVGSRAYPNWGNGYSDALRDFLSRHVRDATDGPLLMHTHAEATCGRTSYAVGDGYDRQDGLNMSTGLVPSFGAKPCMNVTQNCTGHYSCNFERYNGDTSKSGRGLFTKSTCSVDQTFSGAAGSVVSTARDMASWIHYLYDPQRTFLKPGTLTELIALNEVGGFVDIAAVLPALKKQGFCENMPEIEKDNFFGHAGTYPGYHSIAMYSVARNMSFAMIWNSAPYKTPRNTAEGPPQSFQEWLCIVGDFLAKGFLKSNG